MTSGDPRHPAPPQLIEHLTALGVHGRGARRAIGLLTRDWHTLAELIRRTALPRRSVEDLLTALGTDLDRRGDDLRITPNRVPDYLALADDGNATTEAAPHITTDADTADEDAALAAIARDIAGGPPPTPAMDHVPADAETVLRRAQWFDTRYLLDGARVLILGDHDLTSLALCARRPELAVTVVDLDERVLAYVDGLAAERGYDIRCLHADLRFGLPPTATGWADLVFSDPPYTPEGMALFAARGVAALRDPVHAGRLVLAYGYSTRSPALGLKVQQELLRAGLVFEAILPSFHRYHGAQAIGSAADLYVCQPTTRGKAATGRGAPGQATRTAIYTHGPQSVESGAGAHEAASAVLREQAAAEGCTVVDRAPGWAQPIPARRGEAVATELTADPGPWLLRTLLATNADRVALLVPNNHPDLTSAAGQTALAELLRGKYRVRFLRSTPGPAHAIVLATAVPADEVAAADQVRITLLRKAHGTVGNVWREALIAASGGAVTKNAAREAIAALAPPRVDLTARLIDLPRHQIAALLAAAHATP